MIRSLSVTFLLLAACATIGDETAFPAPLESGIGPFRPLRGDETGVNDQQAGRILSGGGAYSRVMRAANTLYYVEADIPEEPAERNPDLPDFEVDWDQVGPRQIRSAALTLPQAGTANGEVFFTADAGWQGGEVFDPWAIEENGSVTLYFAGAGGIGVVRGDGPSTQLLENARAPSVVDYEGERWMFFERNNAIGLATLNADTATVVSENLDLGENTLDAAETAQLRPGATVYTSPTGRTSVRIYFESRFDDGTSAISVSATQDGMQFDRSIEILTDRENAGEPSPFITEGLTLLYGTYAFERGGVQRRVPFAGIAPARFELVPSVDE